MNTEHIIYRVWKFIGLMLFNILVLPLFIFGAVYEGIEWTWQQSRK